MMSNEIVDMMSNDGSFKDLLIKCFSSVVYCSALDEKHIICQFCGNQYSLDAVYICETAHMTQSSSTNFFSASQCIFCGYLFAGDDVLRYSVNKMRDETNLLDEGRIAAGDSVYIIATEKNTRY